MLIMAAGLLGTLALLAVAVKGPSAARATNRRLESVRERHSKSNEVATQAQLKRILASRSQSKVEGLAQQLIPKPALLRQRLERTGKNWTLAQYGLSSLTLISLTTLVLVMKGVPFFLALFTGLFVGIGLPHFIVGKLIKRRVAAFTARFPDAIELMVRGLRSGLPITETLGNLADVLRKRAQMKLKIKAMSSESKASAWIVGSLPFIVFIMISFVNPNYMLPFFSDERLMVTGTGGLIWMGIGVFIMAKMCDFEI